MIGIYKIENIVTKKCYIGQSKDIYHRWTKHKTALRSNTHCNRHLQSSWNKYGENSFDFSILKLCKQEELDYFEKLFIKKYNTIENGYNLDAGGNGVQGFKHTKEQLEKMIKIQNPFPILQFDFQFNLIKEYLSISQASKENKYTKDCILGCCEHTRKDKLFYKDSYWVYKYEYENDNFSWENYLNGIWSCEKKIKDKHTKRNRKIIQYSLNREVVNIWETFKDIEQAGFTRNQVLDICNHRKNKKNHKGYLWAYEDYDFSDGYFDNFEKKYTSSMIKRMKRVLAIDKNKNIVKIFVSIAEACDFLETTYKKLQTIIKNRKYFKNMFFAFEDDIWFNCVDEHCLNMYVSESKKKKIFLKIDDNGNIISKYDRLFQAANENNASSANICRAIQNHKKCANFYWDVKFINN